MASFTPSEASPGANAQLCWNIFLANVKNKAEQSEKKKSTATAVLFASALGLDTGNITSPRLLRGVVGGK